MTQAGIELIIREHKYNEKEKCYLQVQRDCFVYLKKNNFRVLVLVTVHKFQQKQSDQPTRFLK